MRHTRIFIQRVRSPKTSLREQMFHELRVSSATANQNTDQNPDQNPEDADESSNSSNADPSNSVPGNSDVGRVIHQTIKVRISNRNHHCI